jgi:hypothetical protein
MFDRVLLGTIDNRSMYLTKHKWECNWSWGFGYIGNKFYHTHLERLISGNDTPHEVDKIFSNTKITQEQWWVIRDLFTQAYALSKAAQVYKQGGHQTAHHTDITYVIVNKDMETAINNDLEKVLNKVWDYICNIAL